jgi:uncharacterized protein (TIGR03118 family)
MIIPTTARTRRAMRLKAALLAAGLGAALASCGGGSGSSGGPSSSSGSGMPSTPPTVTAAFTATNVVADSGTGAAHVDPKLINAWGLAFNPTGFVWVANQGSSTSTLYDGKGVPQSLVVAIPPGAGGNAGSTGIVYNGTQDFKVSKNGVSGVAAFIFVGTGGTVSGWSPAVDRTNAVTMVDTAANGAGPAAYTGLTLSNYAGVNYLYAADFRNGRVDVYDPSWQKVTLPGGSFNDPNLPSGYAPFGIQAIGDRVYVTYAQHAPSGPRENLGPGLGLVDVFSANGALVRRFASNGALNAPWGVALAPAGFTGFANMLLIGNFGDGKINAFDPASGAMVGTLGKADKTPIVIDGLWGIGFGNGLNDQPANTLFYAAGPGDGAHGLYGRIDPQ